MLKYGGCIHGPPLQKPAILNQSERLEVVAYREEILAALRIAAPAGPEVNPSSKNKGVKGLKQQQQQPNQAKMGSASPSTSTSRSIEVDLFAGIHKQPLLRNKPHISRK